MSQKSTVKKEKSSQKAGSNSSSFAAKEDSHVAYEGENNEEISVSAPPPSRIRSPTGSSYGDDPFLGNLIRATNQSPLNQRNNEEEYQSEQGDSNSSSNPPPLVLPPLDTVYDDSFIEMVKRAVNQHHRLNFIGSQQLDNNIHSQKSFGSVLTFGDDKVHVMSSHIKDDEEQVENPRREKLECIHGEEDPLLNFSISGSGGSLCFDDKSNELTPSQKFFVLQKNPLHVNDLDYVAKSQPAQLRQVDDSQRSVISNPSGKLEIEKKSETEQQQQRQQQQQQQQQQHVDDLNSPSFSSSQKDFSSWLCFDSDSQLLKFKDTIASDESPFGEVVKQTEDESYQLCSSQEGSYQDKDNEKKFMKEQIFSGEFNEDSFSSIDIEKHIINTSTPKRDIVATGGSAKLLPRAEASTSAVTSPQRHGSGRKTRSGIIYNSLTPEAVRRNISEAEEGQQQQQGQDEHDNEKSINDDLLL